MTQHTNQLKQRGAALVVAMMLLLVLTILAISGMNSASLEFVMAGNEQFHQNAFQAAESGIADVLANVALNPDPLRTPDSRNGSPPASADQFTATVVPQLNGVPLPAAAGSSLKKMGTYHYEITSTGTSARNATATNVQGVQQPAPMDSTFHPIDGLGSTLSPPPAP